MNSPLDSARLDIMHPKLWGRAEAVRMRLRDATEATAPISFARLVGALGGGASGLHHALTFRTYPRDAISAAEYRRKTMADSNQE